MKTTWRTEWPHALLIAAQFVLAAVTWNSAPDRIPVHWGLDGQPDRYGGRFEGLFAMPLISVALYFVMQWLPRFDPGKANYPAFAGAYGAIRLALTVTLTVIYASVHLWLRGQPVSVATLMPLIAGAMCVVLGAVMGKVRPNWFFGIRTPWTLSSKLSWNRSHRVGGWLFILVGLLMMVAAVVRSGWAIWTMIAAPLGAAIVVTAYSYFVWRSDPEKVPPAGTLPASEG